MADAINKPVIFLAFANDRDDTIGYLRNLPNEARRLREVLDGAVKAGLCEVVLRTNSTADDIFKVFQDPAYRNRVAIFHYGGHANGYQLLLESAAGESAAADAGGLAGFLAQQQGLHLVVLNGCSTQQQTQGLLDANIAAVISTSRSIDDQVATDFAYQFYRGLAGGANVQTAYSEAEASVQTAKGGNTRGLYFGDAEQSSPEADRWPWNLYLREGSEIAALWNLPEAVDDPLFGLPVLPEQDLPESPYRHLNWFTRADAEVFFGRGHQIRALYDQLTAPRTPPIMMFYGQSGVGKSSVLDAGLIPRLERDYEVRYLRRTAVGLLATLWQAFADDETPARGDGSIGATWQAKEVELGRPLIVFLDQVEELYTRPSPDVPDELAQLLGALQTIFGDINQRPRGKLVLGFRKEWLAELETQLVEQELPRTKFFLEPLDRRGIIEAVEGPARSERLREHYRLTVEDGLAVIIADDLLEDRDSAIAPTLQILLTKMWTKATEEDNAHPQFTQALYQDLKRDGILLSDFLDQQIEAFRDRYPDAVDSGLLLDIVALHTTALGTAGQCSLADLQTRYAHLDAALPDLLQQCKDLYLLSVAGGGQKGSSGTTRLAHDTLAPLVRERFEDSDMPGQRARRILDNRSVDWADNKVGTPLDAADLALVINGLDGTRALREDEQRLVDASLQQQVRRERRARAWLTFGVVAIVAIIVSGAFAWYSKRAADFQLDRARTQSLVIQSRAQQDDSLDLALLLALEVERHGDLFESRRLLWEGLESSPQLETLLRGHADDVRAVAWSPDGLLLASAAGTAPALLVWDIASDDPVGRPLPGAEAGLWSLDFSPDGRWLAAGADDGAVLLWKATGPLVEPRRLISEPKSGKRVYAVRFSPDSRSLAAARGDNAVELWDTQTDEPASLGALKGATDQLRALAWSPDGRILAAAGMDKKVWRWDVVTDTVVETPLTGHRQGIMSLDWSDNGHYLASGSLDGSVGLWHLDPARALQERNHRRPYPQVGPVTALVWSRDSRRLIIAGNEGRVLSWEIGKSSLRPLAPPAGGQAAALLSLTSSPDGRRLASGSGPVVALWRADPGPRLGTKIALGASETSNAALSPNGRKLAASGKDPVSGDWALRLWSAPTGEPLHGMSSFESRRQALVWSNGGMILHAAGTDRTVREIAVTSGRILAEWQAQWDQAARLWRLAWGGGGTRLAAVDRDGRVELWDTERRELLAPPQDVSAERPLLLAWNADADRLASGDAAGAVHLWDGETGRLAAQQPTGHVRAITSLAWHPGGMVLTSGSSDGGVRFWDAASGAPDGNPFQLGAGDAASITRLAWSPDGSTLALVTAKRKILLMDAARRKIYAGPLLGHDDDITALLFDPTGSRLTSVDNSGKLWRWDLDPRSWKNQACSLARRNLNEKERQQYLPWARMIEPCRKDMQSNTWRFEP